MSKYKPYVRNLKVNSKLPYIMHIDMNSYFASCEQQENPLIRGKPVGVVPYLNNKSAILAASYEAKALGIKTGTRVFEAKKICPNMVFYKADVNKYRYINKCFMKVFSKFSPKVKAKSIDEAYLNFAQLKNLNGKGGYSAKSSHKDVMTKIANSIKVSLKQEVGEYITCSIGVGTNTFIAKVASNINKPNGFYYVDHSNIHTFYDVLNSLQDLHGVGPKISARLNTIGINTPNDFLNTDISKLRGEFKLFGYHWYLRLRGYEVDDISFSRKNVGNSFHLTKFTNNKVYLQGVLLKLCTKTGDKLRKLGYSARCFGVYLLFVDGTSFGKTHRISKHLSSTNDIYKEILWVFNKNPYKQKQVRIIGISTSMLAKQKCCLQNDLFGKVEQNTKLYKSLDKINNKYGKFTIYPATLNDYKDVAEERISFGN